jgi:hypothetical protein
VGHALGLGDVEFSSASGDYIDDNFNGTTNSLLNSFAASIDSGHPEATVGIQKHMFDAALFDSDNPASGAPFLLMETNGDSGSPSPAQLDNDSFAGRQYLYPVAVPEPNAWLMMGLVVSLIASWKTIASSKTR